MYKEMTMGQLLLHIGQLIEEYPHMGVYPAHVCIWHEKLEIHFCGHTDIAHPVFMKLAEYQTPKGLTSSQWNQLAKSIYDYVRRNEP